MYNSKYSAVNAHDQYLFSNFILFYYRSGYALIQLPEFVLILYELAKERLDTRNKGQSQHTIVTKWNRQRPNDTIHLKIHTGEKYRQGEEENDGISQPDLTEKHHSPNLNIVKQKYGKNCIDVVLEMKQL